LTVSLEDAGFEIRDLISWLQWQGFPKSMDISKAIDNETDAKKWEGWGTALKPSHEPAVLARKPLKGTVAENVLRYGTGGLNIDATRIPFGDESWPGSTDELETSSDLGRWPGNIYYCPKPARAEKELGCDELQGKSREEVTGRKVGSAGQQHARSGLTRQGEMGNHHPTVKPVRLMRWLLRMVTPPGGVVLEPFAGSGTTLVASELEGLETIGIEREPEYVDICRARVEGVIDDD
jgi:hypothetical protein